MSDATSPGGHTPQRPNGPRRPRARRTAAIRWTVLVLVALGGAAAILVSQTGLGFLPGVAGAGTAGGVGDAPRAADGAEAGAGSAGSAGRAIRTPVRVTTPTFGSLERTFEVSGYVESDQVITVTPKVQGTLEELLVDLGDQVSRGRKIAEIDDQTYRLDLRQAEANFAAAESTFNRTQELYESDATSRQNYDQARSAYDAAEAQLELARLQMSYTSVSAPITGTVIQRHTAAGSVVGTQSPLVTVADLTDMVVQAKIPEQHFLAFSSRPGRIEVHVDLPSLKNRTVTGRIRTVSPYVNPSSRNFDVVVDLTEATPTLRPGMFVELTFVLDRREEVHALPFAALSDDGELWYLRDDGTVAAERVEVGFSGEERFVVSDDWADRRVVIEGQNFLTSGQQVTVLDGEGRS
ncbi:MAG: efflux RND transporter periplasmic adaptor subunit [Spirochaetes bacterium]|nr:efflux RND transporter periplasmic adaptor subunit [Spirochaetota bacterium]